MAEQRTKISVCPPLGIWILSPHFAILQLFPEVGKLLSKSNFRWFDPLPFILGVISAESFPLATKVTWKVIRWLFWQKTSVESYALPKKSVGKIPMAKFPHKHGTGDMGTTDKGQGTMDKGQWTTDVGHGTRNSGQQTTDNRQQTQTWTLTGV
jgi:hypothetical protein